MTEAAHGSNASAGPAPRLTGELWQVRAGACTWRALRRQSRRRAYTLGTICKVWQYSGRA